MGTGPARPPPIDYGWPVPSDAGPDLQTITVLLDAAGLRPPPEEVERLAELYGPIRRQLAQIYAAEIGGSDPASVFRAGEVGAR